MKNELNKKMKIFIENGNYIVRTYNESNESLTKKMDEFDYHFYIETANNIFIFTTKDKVIKLNIKDFDWKMLWNRLGDIPTNNEDELEESFLHFEVGTLNTDVWHWFEWFFDITLGDEIYN